MKALAHLKTNLDKLADVDYRGTYPMLRIEKSRQFADSSGNIKLYKDRIPYMATTTAKCQTLLEQLQKYAIVSCIALPQYSL
jgi:hypothetical protein